MTGGDPLGADERAELASLRAEVSALRADVTGGPDRRWARRGRWTGAVALLLLAALLGGAGLVAGYLRGALLDTDTYVETVTPVLADPAVQDAVARRLTDVIMTRTDVAGLARTVAERLVADGVPRAVTALVDPLVDGLASFLYQRIRPLLATEQAQAVWQQVNTVAHQALVTVLTGRQGTYLSSTRDSVTLDLGAVLSFVKQKLVEQGLTFVARVPDVSVPYTLVQSDKLPEVRAYARVLDVAATWLPWVALALALAGVLAAPNRRRGIITGALMLGVVAALLLFAVAAGRAYYQDNLPASVSVPAALVVFDALLRFLVAALRATLVALAFIVVIALLWGPSPPAVLVRRWADLGLTALGTWLSRTGHWAVATGRALAPARHVIYVLLCLLAVVGYVAAERPSAATAGWLVASVALIAFVVEAFTRAATAPPFPRTTEPPPPTAPTASSPPTAPPGGSGAGSG